MSEFAKEKSKIIGYSYQSSLPDFIKYINSVDDDQMSVFTTYLDVLKQDGSVASVGHALTVEGYMYGAPKSGGNTQYFAEVFDGWFMFARYINYNYGKFYRQEGVFFRG